MSESAAFLVDSVLPFLPYRQWTLSLPKQIRFLLINDGKLLSKVFASFLRVVFSWQRRRARKAGIAEPLVGGISFLQNFGSLIQVNPHCHAWLPDGVFYRDADEKMRFHYLEPPTIADITMLVLKTQRRVLKLCNREFIEPEDEQLSLMRARAQAMESGLPLPVDGEQPKAVGLSAFERGFSLHAGLSVKAKQRRKLEKLLRYGMRPAIANKRLSLTKGGKVRLKLRKSYYTGQTAILFKPVDFLRRLVAVMPRPRQNTVRFFGVFAPHSKWYAAVKALVPKPVSDSLTTVTKKQKRAKNADEKPKRRGCSRSWAQLLRRVFEIDILVCPQCHGPMKFIAVVNSPEAIEKICKHIGFPPKLPNVAPARAPPQTEIEEWD